MPDHSIPKNELIDIFYNGLTTESRTYLDSCAGCIFRERTVQESKELLGNIAKNHADWDITDPTPYTIAYPQEEMSSFPLSRIHARS